MLCAMGAVETLVLAVIEVSGTCFRLDQYNGYYYNYYHHHHPIYTTSFN
jgi:lysozyme family protein